MDTTRFDTIARHFGSGMTRREALRGLAASVAAVTAGGVLMQAEDAAAKRRRRKNKHHNRKASHDYCGRHGDGCGAYDTDTGAFTAPYCCHGYQCVYDPGNGSWTCQAG